MRKHDDEVPDGQFPLTEAQREELGRRLASLEGDRREGIPWEALKAELEQCCP
jgi:putative addiction module component (TIGR02574 family)